MIVGGTVGGTNDLIARVVATHLGKYLPGKPTVISKNMAAASGAQAAGYLYSVAQRDGTEFGNFNRVVILDPLFGRGTFKPQEFLWMGAPSSATDLCLSWNTSPVKTLADALKTELILGVSAPTQAPALLMQRLSGGKIRVITGYGSAESNLAMERGEVSGRCGVAWESVKASYPEWIEKNQVNYLVQFAFSRHPELPNVPLISDFAKTPLDQQVVKMLVTPNLAGFPFAAPPGLLPEVKTMLVTAFANAIKDPGLIEDMKKIDFTLAPVSGPALQEAVADAYSFPPEAVKRAQEITTP
jgi:tripartite-type tricarboxylate transporter receptor subunit TctC